MKTMMLLLALLTTSAFANTYASKYEGQNFATEEYAACESEFRRITQKVDSLEGYLVLDGGCLAYGPKNFKIKFNYEAPVAGRIERFRLEMKSKETCAERLAVVENRINQTGNTFIANYCNGRTLQIDYIDNTYSMVRGLKLSAELADKNLCTTEIKNINTALVANGMYPLISFCRTVKRMSGVTTYSPVLFYTARYDINLTAITGKKTTNGCFNQSVNVERNFAEAGVVLAHKFCAEREYLIYVNKTKSFGEVIKKYSGLVYDNLATCQTEVKNLLSKFATKDRVSVYYYCAQLNEKRIRPVVHYFQKK